MEMKTSDVLDDYERETFDIIRSSYANLNKEINDALNNVLAKLMKEINGALDNVLTMTSFELEDSLKQSLNNIRKSLIPKSDISKKERHKTSSVTSKKVELESYEEILDEEDTILFDMETYHTDSNMISKKFQGKDPLKAESSKNKTNNSQNNYKRNDNVNTLETDYQGRVNSNVQQSSSKSNNKTNLIRVADTVKQSALEVKKDATYSKIGERYQCGECDFSALNSVTTDRHVKYKHKQEGPYNCERCKYYSINESFLVKHMKKAHNVIRQYTYT